MDEFAAMQRGRFYEKGRGGMPMPLPLIPGVGDIVGPLAGWNSWLMTAAHLGQPNISNMFAASGILVL